MKKVHAAAAKIPQVSANAFKVIPTVPSHQLELEGQATEASVNVDEEAEDDQIANSDVSASKSRKRSHSELRSSSPVTHSVRSSSPVASIQKKKKFHKHSHAEFRSSSPVANSLHSLLPVARSSSPVNAVIPLKKKAKTEPQSAPSAHKDQPTIPVYREGAEIKHKKPKASDYEDIVQALILRAASQYEALVSTQDSFPDTAQRLKWARKSWSDANNNAGHEYEITDEIGSLVDLSNLILLFLVI